jgi:predicted HTH transcriptional regulator
MNLTNKPNFDEAAFEKILQTCVAIANIGRNSKGYVIVGVAENAATALRVEKIFSEKAISFGGFYITGTEHEALAMGKNLDQLFQEITNKVGSSQLSEPLKSYVNSHIKCVRYFEKTLFVFEVIGQDAPSLYGKKYYSRQGLQVFEVEPQNFSSLFLRFNK